MPPARPLSTPEARIASGVCSHTDISAASPLLNNYRGWEADGIGAGRISGRTHAMVIDVQIFNEESMAIAQAKITDLLRERHGLAPDQENDFTVQTQEEVARAAPETSRVMTFLLASIAGISLFVGGIGIMNVMLVSVGERTREVGLRLFIGARARDVLSQFLVEAMFVAIAVSAAEGLFFGFYSAWKASRFDPIVALRHE